MRARVTLGGAGCRNTDNRRRVMRDCVVISILQGRSTMSQMISCHALCSPPNGTFPPQLGNLASQTGIFASHVILKFEKR
jgi:hypothetical protein